MTRDANPRRLERSPCSNAFAPQILSNSGDQRTRWPKWRILFLGTRQPLGPCRAAVRVDQFPFGIALPATCSFLCQMVAIDFRRTVIPTSLLVRGTTRNRPYHASNKTVDLAIACKNLRTHLPLAS